MSIIVVESVDGIGKTTIINQLVEKYPERFSKYSFPTSIFKSIVDEELDLDLNIQTNTISRLIHYHTAFEIDFMEHIEHLDKLSRKGVLLLDRYYMSNIVYAAANFKKHGYPDHPFLKLLENIDRGITPDCVLFIRAYDAKDFPQKDDSHFTPEEFNLMQYDYSMVLHKLRDKGKIKCFETILTLSNESRNKGELFKTVEEVLTNRGFL